MPSQLPSLRTDEAVRFIEERCFPPTAADAPGTLRCGLEIEWLTTPLGDPRSHLPAEEALRLVEIVGDLPGCSKVTLEPGGQIELSSAPGDLADVCRLMGADARVARRRLEAAGVAMVSVGLDPTRPPRRVLEAPRYVAMEKFFDLHGPAGRTMMCSTGSVQVNLSLGSGEEQEARWRQANLIGPAMTAAFANSPFLHGAPSGWRSSRAAVWRMLDLSRTSPVPLVGSAANAWARYALNAQVMLVRDATGAFLPDLEHLTFGAWMAKGHAVGFPTEDDLSYHLTTLFPPVRPRGWLELRVLDALGDPWWPVPLLVGAAI
ncbi:MAG: glutamate-cysteine ligase family protein, partial [Actinomycetota bacterium]